MHVCILYMIKCNVRQNKSIEVQLRHQSIRVSRVLTMFSFPCLEGPAYVGCARTLEGSRSGWAWGWVSITLTFDKCTLCPVVNKCSAGGEADTSPFLRAHRCSPMVHQPVSLPNVGLWTLNTGHAIHHTFSLPFWDGVLQMDQLLSQSLAGLKSDLDILGAQHPKDWLR